MMSSWSGIEGGSGNKPIRHMKSSRPAKGGIPPRFEAIWRKVVRYDAEPSERVFLADPDARSKIEESLERFVCGSPVLLDGAELVERPRFVPNPSAAELLGSVGSGWEFVVLLAGESGYWAILEEENEWLIFESA